MNYENRPVKMALFWDPGQNSKPGSESNEKLFHFFILLFQDLVNFIDSRFIFFIIFFDRIAKNRTKINYNRLAATFNIGQLLI